VPVNYSFRARGDGDDDGDFDAEWLLDQIAEDLMEYGDLQSAIDRLLAEGFTTPDGEHIDGLYDLMEKLRDRRRELEQEADPSGRLAQYREKMAEIEAMEDAALSDMEQLAETMDDPRAADVTRESVAQRRLQREFMPLDTGERISALRDYEFVSHDAQRAFDEMLAQLREEVLSSYFEQAKDFASGQDPEALERMRLMMDTLSQMLEQQQRGEELDPTFEQFMADFGDFFPGAESLEDVVRILAERAAAAEAMFNSLSAEQQAELRSLFSQTFGDMNLQFSLSRLVANLRQMTPDLDWNDSARFRGQGRGGFNQAASVAEEMAALSRLEEFIGQSAPSRGLPEIDIDEVRRHLGPDAAAAAEKLQKAAQALRESRFVDERRGTMELSAAGVRQIGSAALRELFAQLRRAPLTGSHRHASTSRGHDREETSRPYEPGEPFNLHLPHTLRNAVLRQGVGTPVRLLPEDFVVEEHETQTRSATVIAVDLSLSMAMRHNLAPAKKMVLALSQLIHSAYPRDFLKIVGFGEVADEIRLADVPSLYIDHQYGTNLQHALALSRHLMRDERGDKQIIVVTDGEPTAHLMDGGVPFFSYPPAPETLHLTMAEVLRCTRAKITINLFALDIERTHFPFVEQIAKINGGRVFYTDRDNLGKFVVDDFVRNRS